MNLCHIRTFKIETGKSFSCFLFFIILHDKRHWRQCPVSPAVVGIHLTQELTVQKENRDILDNVLNLKRSPSLPNVHFKSNNPV